MTAIVARPPLQILSMSAAQAGSRRHSARLQQKDDPHYEHGDANGRAGANQKKRKMYDEDDDGFVFSRVKKSKPQKSASVQHENTTNPTPPPETERKSTKVQNNAVSQKVAPSTTQDEVHEPPKKRTKRMSFSTPAAKADPTVRRSKRLSSEAQEPSGSPVAKEPQLLRPTKSRKDKVAKDKLPQQQPENGHPPGPAVETTQTSEPEETHASTKIALPFADTPVISRNKAMREGKSGKSERRSSLGLRGRRASSLIDSGTSNALPHTEVDTKDFYKHIESELIEPKRMRQLLTWCATRAMHTKPKGTDFVETSARNAAIVIEEELLKELANRSELSDWFSREDAPATVVPLPERPHPKNTTNAEKVAQLEDQIKRLRSEKDALDALLRPPAKPQPLKSDPAHVTPRIELLLQSDTDILRNLDTASLSTEDMNLRVNTLISKIGPAIDTFADGVHKINQYRIGADGIADSVLSTCADKLAERERAGRRKALGTDEDQSPGRELSSVLRGLSKAER